jgi:hypothetical protein
MHIRDAQGAKPFGRRRAPAEADGGGPAQAGADRLRPDRPAGALGWTLRISGIAGLLAIAAGSYLARVSQPGPDPTMAAIDARQALADPETTGAITAAGAAAVTRLDPCQRPAADRLRP